MCLVPVTILIQSLAWAGFLNYELKFIVKQFEAARFCGNLNFLTIFKEKLRKIADFLFIQA